MFEADDNIKSTRTLWQQFTEGDSRAFDALIKQHYAALFSYGLKLSKDKELLQDALHDAFVSLWHNRHLIDPERQPYFYLLTNFRNQLVKSLKNTLVLDESSFDLLTEDGHIEAHIIQGEDIVKVQTLIQKLPARHQEALHLRFFEELDNDQIAELMQINKQSVANLLHSGLKMLRKLWDLTLLLVLSSVAS